ncbi:regulatory protein GemA [Azospirillum argentinense]|uniref:Regulatory protein GemA n=1 Tax=Azospirillum argentinense TaxID=2970906 RepID=A0ABW8VE67_9PROT
MTATVKKPAASDTLAPLRAKVQTLRRQVPTMADEDTWRAFLGLTTGGVTSTRTMAERQLKAVVEALHKAGAPRASTRSSRPGKATGKPRYAATPQFAKLRALWITLADAGVIRDRSDAALEAFIRNRTGQDMGQLDVAGAARAIEALKAMARRKGVALEG